MPNNLFTEYFRFTKKEQIGITTILILIGVLIALPFFYPLFIKHPANNFTSFQKEIAALQIKQVDSTQKHGWKNYDESNYQSNYEPSEKNHYTRKAKGELFYFDPNTLDEAGWQKLGVRDKTIATIKNYISKGGKFYEPEDLGKIWGFFEDEKERLIPFVQIKNVEQNTGYIKKEYPVKTFDKPKYTPSIVDINTGDTTAFIALPGIGSKLAQRIITFREKLGGFYKIEQVGETFALPDSTFQKIKPRLVMSSANIKHININTATLDEMKTHPYLRYVVANAIVQYRTQHGNFSSINDLKKIIIITDDIFAKAAPYLQVN